MNGLLDAGNQYDSSSKWYVEDAFSRELSTPDPLLRDYQQEAISICREEEKAIYSRLIRRCNNGRKCEYLR